MAFSIGDNYYFNRHISLLLLLCIIVDLICMSIIDYLIKFVSNTLKKSRDCAVTV